MPIPRRRRTALAHPARIPIAGLLLLAAACADATGAGNTPRGLLFVSSRGAGLNGIGQQTFDLWRMDVDGGGLQNLTSQPVQHYTALSVSRDGRKLAFMSTRGGTGDIWVMNADGTGLARLTNQAGGVADGANSDPRWSPDGKRIAFATNRENRTVGTSASLYDVYVMNADGSSPRNVSAAVSGEMGTAGVTVVGWTPAGQVVFRTSTVVNQVPRNQVYVVNADGTGAQHLMPLNDYSPAWSPDGSKVAFVREEGGSRKLHIMNADGSGVQAVDGPAANHILPRGDNPNSRNFDYDPWSPDGTRLAFESANGIYVVHPDGSGLRKLTPQWAYFNGWSPDGKQVAFSSGASGSLVLDVFVVNADGSGLANLTNDPAEDRNAVWLRR